MFYICFNQAYPKHKFEYAVKNTQTDDIKQSEERHGISVKGEYSFFEPDGTIRKVQYHDDGDSGFNAIVTRYVLRKPISIHITTFNECFLSSANLN